MTMQGCVKTVLDESMYSSPVPVIGLYIAGASLVCFLAMFHDIVSGFRHRKRWLPCQWFSLNSVTLTMLGVAAKIPVDLTTPMPSALDQFSKLSGTTFLCIAMAFLMPSVGMKQTSECINNLVALTIVVVTVIVNVCLQIHTGVIFMFVVEHIITMCCMFGFLIVLWVSFVVATSEKELSIDQNKDVFTKGKGSMLERLKVAYLYAFNYNPQFVLCRNVELHESTGLCIICSTVLIRAAIKSLTWKFCRGSSDYVWSVWPIIMIQILTIILGSVANISRSLALPSQVRVDLLPLSTSEGPMLVIVSNPALRLNQRQRVGACLFIILVFQLVILHISVLYPLMFVRCLLQKMFGLFFKHKSNDHKDMDKYRHLINGSERGMSEWVLGRAVKDIKRCMDTEQSESSSSYHLSGILAEKLHPLRTMKHSKVSSLSMVLLVRIAQVSVPPELSASLVKSYVEDTLLSMSFQDRKDTELAKAVWRGKDFNNLPRFREIAPSEADLNRALSIIQVLNTEMPSDAVWREVKRITDIITNSFDHSSVENLYRLMEESFVEMLHDLLVQLPHAIYKEVTESSAEEFDTRVRRCLGILSKVQSLETHVNWSFPVGCDIQCLITAGDTVDEAGNAPYPTGDVSNDVAGDTVDEAGNAPHPTGDTVVHIGDL